MIRRRAIVRREIAALRQRSAIVSVYESVLELGKSEKFWTCTLWGNRLPSRARIGRPPHRNRLMYCFNLIKWIFPSFWRRESEVFLDAIDVKTAAWSPPRRTLSDEVKTASWGKLGMTRQISPRPVHSSARRLLASSDVNGQCRTQQDTVSCVNPPFEEGDKKRAARPLGRSNGPLG